MSAVVVFPGLHLLSSFSNGYRSMIKRFGGSDMKARGI